MLPASFKYALRDAESNVWSSKTARCDVFLAIALIIEQRTCKYKKQGIGVPFTEYVPQRLSSNANGTILTINRNRKCHLHLSIVPSHSTLFHSLVLAPSSYIKPSMVLPHKQVATHGRSMRFKNFPELPRNYQEVYLFLVSLMAAASLILVASDVQLVLQLQSVCPSRELHGCLILKQTQAWAFAVNSNSISENSTLQVGKAHEKCTSIVRGTNNNFSIPFTIGVCHLQSKVPYTSNPK